MTFEAMIDNSNETNSAAVEAPKEVSGESLSVKVFFGNEIRRVTYVGNGYVALRDLCAKLYTIEPATVILKYQDSDEDRITMSSDNELLEAVKLAKDKTLRVHIEARTPIPAQEATAAPPFGGASYEWRGPFRGRGGFGPHGQHRGGFPHGGPHGPHHGHHRGGFSHGPHHAPGFMFGGPVGPFHHPPHHQPPHPASPVQASAEHQQTTGGPNVNFPTPHVFGHVAFSPTESEPQTHCRNARASPYARCAWKERKHAMKEHVKFMKQNAATEEDRQAIKAFKQQMREEWKDIKKAEKKDKKWEKKDKRGKKDKKDKKEKCGKKDKQRYVARHVADVTIPDNSELPADSPATKTWRLRNDGLVAWPADSQLLFISRRGDDLNGPERVFVGAVEPAQEIEVSVTFVTPAEPGRYIGYYRMATGEGSKFGQRVWVSFLIPERTTGLPNQAVPVVASPAKTTTTTAQAASTPAAPSAPTDLLDVNME